MAVRIQKNAAYPKREGKSFGIIQSVSRNLFPFYLLPPPCLTLSLAYFLEALYLLIGEKEVLKFHFYVT